jgi:ribA/ribD-fused uncharacterized protein
MHYFWGSELSQWWSCRFSVDGIWYSTAEQYMMAAKAMCFHDEQAEAKIMATADPREQKAIGRTVKDFDPDVWNAVARDMVYYGNYAKFSQDPILMNHLLLTKDKVLVEASPYDKIWGVGRSEQELKNGAEWNGTNWLGEVLMKVRQDFFDFKYMNITSDFNWSE